MRECVALWVVVPAVCACACWVVGFGAYCLCMCVCMLRYWSWHVLYVRVVRRGEVLRKTKEWLLLSFTHQGFWFVRVAIVKSILAVGWEVGWVLSGRVAGIGRVDGCPTDLF